MLNISTYCAENPDQWANMHSSFVFGCFCLSQFVFAFIDFMVIREEREHEGIYV